MSVSCKWILVLVAVAMGSVSASSSAMPPDQIVEFTIHEDPSDAESASLYAVRLYLWAAEQKGNSIGWEIDQVRIVKMIVPGQYYQAWSEELPYVETLDGLWWVEHVDPLHPGAAEFQLPPLVEGRAEPFIEGMALDYSIQGYQVPAKSRTIFSPSTKLKTSFLLAHLEDPSEEEPVEEDPPEPETEEDAS